jgi:protein-disulfide isomerase
VAKRVDKQVRAHFELPPDVEITLGPLKPSEFPNYDALVITLKDGRRTQDVNFLLSKDGNTLIRITKLDLSKDPYAEVMKKIDTTGRPTRGNKNAKVVVVNYDDFECPYCSHMHATLFPGIFKEYGDRVLFIYKDFPLSEIHPWAIHAAVNANCLAAQNNDAYWDFADYIHANRMQVDAEQTPSARLAAIDKHTLEQGQKRSLDLAVLQSCIKVQKDDTVKASLREAEGLGVDGTPTLFVNGRKLGGALPPVEMRAILDSALKDAGVPAPPPAAPSSAPTPAAPAKK